MNRVGIDLGGTKIAVAVISPRGELLFTQRRPTPVNDYPQTLRLIAALVTEAETRTGMAKGSARVGVGTPGAESLVDGRIKNANSKVLNGRSLRRDLTELLRRPVKLANDANCMAVSEAVDGAGLGAGVVFGVILGTGVGGALVINGQLLEGANHIAGEWGHNPLPWAGMHEPGGSGELACLDELGGLEELGGLDELPGPRCYCGASGCIETWLSGPGLLADYHRSGGDMAVSNAEAICELADRNEPVARSALVRYYHRLARGLAAVINLVDPDVIVVAGGLSNHSPIYQQVPKLWQQWVFSDRVDTQLKPALYGDASGVRGAAWLWSQQ